MEAEKLMPSDVEPLLHECVANIVDEIDADTKEQMLASNIAKFVVDDAEQIETECLRAESKKRSNVDRERKMISLTDLGVTYSPVALENALKEKKTILQAMKVSLISFYLILCVHEIVFGYLLGCK